MSNETIQVQRAWLEGLTKHSRQVNRHKAVIDSNDWGQLLLLADLESLQGYIESAKYLLGEKPDEQG